MVFLQTILFHVLIKQLRHKGYGAKSIRVQFDVRFTCPCGCLIPDTSRFEVTSQKPL